MKLKKLLEIVSPGEYLRIYDCEAVHVCDLDVDDGMPLDQRYQPMFNFCYFDLIELHVDSTCCVGDILHVFLKEVFLV